MEGETSNSSVITASKKRKRSNADELEPDHRAGNFSDESIEPDGSTSLEDSLTFSDTLIALRMMRAQFPVMEKFSIQPFILQSQLYSSIKDRTQVDRELELLRREKVLRIFKLNTGQDDHAIMFVEDYMNQIDHVVKRIAIKERKSLDVIDRFKTHVIMQKLDPSIGQQELLLLLSEGVKVKDEHISLLINVGVLVDPSTD